MEPEHTESNEVKNDKQRKKSFHKKSSQPSAAAGKLSYTLRCLMSCMDIHEAELARQTNIKQATLNTVIKGSSRDPRLSTLMGIARYFKVTLEELAGLEPINYDELKNPNRKKHTLVPLLAWEHVMEWLEGDYLLGAHTEWVPTEGYASEKAFALVAKPFMWSTFWPGSVVIIDPGYSTSFYDGSYIVFNEGSILNVKQVVQDGSRNYLKTFDTNLPTMAIPEDFTPIGVIRESRRVFREPSELASGSELISLN